MTKTPLKSNHYPIVRLLFVYCSSIVRLGPPIFSPHKGSIWRAKSVCRKGDCPATSGIDTSLKKKRSCKRLSQLLVFRLTNLILSLKIVYSCLILGCGQAAFGDFVAQTASPNHVCPMTKLRKKSLQTAWYGMFFRCETKKWKQWQKISPLTRKTKVKAARHNGRTALQLLMK